MDTDAAKTYRQNNPATELRQGDIREIMGIPCLAPKILINSRGCFRSPV
ncbi:MAG: hypothetical protein LBK98_04080 [Peptococcaceae bacterium]|nr:hypothetical protein [Peptococcaceae bacterium]